MPATTLSITDLYIDQVNTGKAQAVVDEVLEEAQHEVPGIFAANFTRPLKAQGILRSAAVRRYWDGPRNRKQTSLTIGPHTRTETLEVRTTVADVFTADELARLRRLVDPTDIGNAGDALPRGTFPEPVNLPQQW